MARCIQQTLNLIRASYPTTAGAKCLSSAAFPSSFLPSSRRVSSLSDCSAKNGSADVPDADAIAVQRIEDAIHRIIVLKSAPDWLPFVPGASYWVPPRRGSYGIAQIVHNLSNSLTEEEVMSLTTDRGWPSSSFYVNEKEAANNCTSQNEDDD